MYLEKIKALKIPLTFIIIVIVSAIITFLILGISPETFIAIATIALVIATAYLAYINQKIWIAQDKPFLIFENIATNQLREDAIDEDEFRAVGQN
ncbi:MAG: hypothetical protein ABOK23_03515 [Candidatus Methanoperedens sp.]|nr:hypothetical protein [Candidatus Methanoperedens sp.]MCZ7395784.1 hypothetical protein [Candidatus Methanoperedens sp.]